MKLIPLIRADRTFADGVFMLGDLLRWRHLNLALWAYVRARKLGHPRPHVIEDRIDGIFKHWRETVARSGWGTKSVEDQGKALAAIEADLDRAADWLKQFEAVEAELVAAGGEVDFDAVSAEMKRRGITKMRPPERGVYRNLGVGIPLGPLGLGIPALALLLIIYRIYNRARKRRATAA